MGSFQRRTLPQLEGTLVMNWKSLLSTERNQKLIVEIGANQKPQAQFIEEWKGAKILTLDVDIKQHPDIRADAASMPEQLRGKLDGLLASHVLEHFSYWKTETVLKGWVDCLKENGDLHILVPSLEWAAREVLSEKPSPAVYAQLFAGHVNEWDVHLTGFTMRKLRFLMEKVGLGVYIARTGVYHVRVAGYENEFEALQHYVVGRKGEVSPHGGHS
jgi:predicted SAM-dependent methyltransferase